MGKVRGKYKPKDENVRKLFAFLSKEEQKVISEVINKDDRQKVIK